MKSSHYRKFFLFICLVLVLVSFSLIFLQTSWFQKKMTSNFVHKVETIWGYSLKFDRCHWNVLSQLELHNVAATRGATDVFRVDEARISYDLSLLSLKIRIRHVLLDHPVLFVQKDDRGRWSLPAGKATAAAFSSRGSQTRVWEWSGATLSISSGTLKGLDENGSVVFRTSFSGSFRLESVIEEDLEKLLMNMEFFGGNSRLRSF